MNFIMKNIFVSKQYSGDTYHSVELLYFISFKCKEFCFHHGLKTSCFIILNDRGLFLFLRRRVKGIRYYRRKKVVVDVLMNV